MIELSFLSAISLLFLLYYCYIEIIYFWNNVETDLYKSIEKLKLFNSKKYLNFYKFSFVILINRMRGNLGYYICENWLCLYDAILSLYFNYFFWQDCYDLNWNNTVNDLRLGVSFYKWILSKGFCLKMFFKTIISLGTYLVITIVKLI